MKVLMFGWEFPPYSSGGLGTACYGLTKGLSKKNVQITFVIPKLMKEQKAEHLNLISADAEAIDHIKIISINSPLVAYASSESYQHMLRGNGNAGSATATIYGANLWEEVHRYALQARNIAKKENFDIIHCHDWMTYLAGINAKQVSGKKMVAHVHATEFDRSGGNPNPEVYKIEKQGLQAADIVIAVSNYTKKMVMDNYHIPAAKIKVVHNAVDHSVNYAYGFNINKTDKLVLYLGRVTLQKGPEYFIHAAKRVCEKISNVKFVMAGDGDMLPGMMELSASLGIADKMLFTGLVKNEEADQLYRMADLYIMPSVSEPFGITPLESLKNGTPVIISKQSGVSEVLTHALKVDFWDIHEMANKIIAALSYDALHATLKENGTIEVSNMNWEKSADKVEQIYAQALGF